MSYDSMKLHHSPWKSHRTPNTTVYSSPRFESPERRKSGRNSSFGGNVDPFLLDVPVEYLKQISSPLSDGELHPRKDGIRKTYKPSAGKNKYCELPKYNCTKLEDIGTPSKSREHRRRRVPSDRRRHKATGFDEYDFPFVEDEVFETGGRNRGRMTLREFVEARKREILDKSRNESSKEPQTPKESGKKGKGPEARDLFEKEMAVASTQDRGNKSHSSSSKNEKTRQSKSKPTIKSVEVLNLPLKNFVLGKQSRP